MDLELEPYSGRSSKAQGTVLTALWCRQKCCAGWFQPSPGQNETRYIAQHPLGAGQRNQQPGHFSHTSGAKQYKQFSTLWEQKPGPGL